MLSRTLDLDGPVHVADFGGAGPTMVLVHGLGGSHANWLAVGPALAAHARVLAPDLPGFGRTPLAGRSAHVHAGVALVDSLLDTVADGPAILVGNSMGGLIAMMQAAACPEKVAGLVLVGPAQPRPRRALVDPAVALTFAAYVFPGVGEQFVRWRAAWLGPERLVPAPGRTAGDLERADWLTPYTAQTIAEDAVRSGPGAQLEVSVPPDLSDADLAAFYDQLASLDGRDISVRVRRDRGVPRPAQLLRPDAA